ncbi:hypothetical protein Tco_1030697 [Tanacetum coccineum]|uniref:Uncharacterized protein n=1 Tax=Tanacetum coccineum TaxID=301880 RepID=A0ABQ5G890_9ASTR
MAYNIWRTPPTTTVFDDEDVTMAMAQTLIKMKEQKAKEKGVAITDVEDSSRIVRPVRSITTLQPLPTIDPKDKGKGVLVEEEPIKIKMRDQGDFWGNVRKNNTCSEKRAGEKKSKESAKKQKLEDVVEEQESAKSDEEASADYEHEKEELRLWLTVVSDEEETVDPKILSTKYPIVDWESQNLGNIDMEDLHDVMDLHRLVEERYATSRPEGYDLMLWGDLKILFQPDEEDEVWRHQHEYNLISWRLFDSCGIHILLMYNAIAIHMMIEKKYPLTQEMLSKMLSRKLEVDHENEMAFELLRFIRSQVHK